MRKLLKWLVLSLMVCSLTIACNNISSQNSAPGSKAAARDPNALQILSGSENRDLATLVEEFGKSQGVPVQFDYAGSVDIMRELANGANSQYDAVWPASSIWSMLGDQKHVLKEQRSIYRTPIVFAVKKSLAQSLGWTSKEVSLDDILTAAEAGKLKFMTTSATQSNSGAMQLLASLSNFAGNPQVLEMKNLQDPAVLSKMKRLYQKVDRTAGSSGWLKDLFVKSYDRYDAMFNYEFLVAQANAELKASGKEPLYVIYPKGGIAIADSPLALVDKGNAEKAAAFSKVQAFLTSPDTQNKLSTTGRRTGLGITPSHVDASVFDPANGFDAKRVLTPINIPEPNVIQTALNSYQSTLRKPSATVYTLDFSGSMAGKGEEQIRAAMSLLLDQKKASEYLIQGTANDISIVIAFNSDVIDVRAINGNNPAQMAQLEQFVYSLHADGGTNIYAAAARGLQEIKNIPQLQNYAVSQILMTDGESEGNLDALQTTYQQLGLEGVPIHAILFGDASTTQLSQIADMTHGKLFDGQSDLIKAFREAKGYN
ncbi:substrate-binding domain-containing protein [soil metagenome]